MVTSLDYWVTTRYVLYTYDMLKPDALLGLDADHISAIDNATRQLVSQGQLPITCGKLHVFTA